MLPKAITEFDFQNLIQELFEHYTSEQPSLFPSDEWFDEVWIHVPAQRQRLREIFSCLVEDLDSQVNEVTSLEALRAFGYKKAIYRNQSVCLMQAPN